MNQLIIIGVISLLILVHEFGHFLMARWVGLPVAIFSIGFGPKIISWKWQTTEFRLSWIPLGGYVLLGIEEAHEFFLIPIWQRMLFAWGGPLANIVMPLGLYAVWNCLMQGISLQGIFILPWSQLVHQAVAFIVLLPQAFSHPAQLSGMIGMVAQGAKVISQDLNRIFPIAILLNLNLAVLNLLPIPGLDGGRMFLLALEKIMPRSQQWHMALTLIGLAMVFGLMIILTLADIKHLIMG